MFAALFAFVLVTAYAADEIPSYVHVCGVKDPNYAECIVDNINNVKSKLCTGIPEFNILPIEPVIIDEIVIYDTDKLKLNLKDSKVTGICNFDVTSHHIIPEKFLFNFDATLKHLDMYSTYDFDIRVLVPLANKGLIHVSADNIGVKLSVELKVATKNGKKQIYAAKVSTILDIKTFNYEFDDSEKDLVQLHEVLKNTINENEKDIISKVKPMLEETVSKLVISVINNAMYNRYEQLFPEQTP